MDTITLNYGDVIYCNVTTDYLLRLGVPADVITAAKIEAEWSDIRKERDQKLTATDWTQMADSPLSDADKTLWATYRQELRDLPDNATSPNDVIWPDLPST